MAKFVVIDELHVVARAPSDMHAAKVRSVRLALADKRWLQRVRRGVLSACQADAALAQCRVSLTR